MQAPVPVQQPAWLKDVSSSSSDDEPSPAEPTHRSPQPFSNQQDPRRQSLEELLDALPQPQSQPAHPSGSQSGPAPPAGPFVHSDGASLFHNQLLGAPVESQNHRGTSAPAGLGFDVRELLRQQALFPSPSPSWGQSTAARHQHGTEPPLDSGQLQQPHTFAQSTEFQHRSGSLSALPAVNVGSHFETPVGLGLRAPSLPCDPHHQAGSNANGKAS